MWNINGNLNYKSSEQVTSWWTLANKLKILAISTYVLSEYGFDLVFTRKYSYLDAFVLYGAVYEGEASVMKTSYLKRQIRVYISTIWTVLGLYTLYKTFTCISNLLWYKFYDFLGIKLYCRALGETWYTWTVIIFELNKETEHNLFRTCPNPQWCDHIWVTLS